MRNLKLILAYDGAEFSGWQVQPGKTTIQGTLASAIGRITAENVLPQGSGRTDAGVHALAQVVTFVTESSVPTENFQKALNDLLPASIRVLEVAEAPADFHARHSARAKTYRYRIFREAICPPFLARYVWHYPYPLDEDAMTCAMSAVVGEHDFTSFAAVDPEKSSKPRADALKTDVPTEDVILNHGKAAVKDPTTADTVVQSRRPETAQPPNTPQAPQTQTPAISSPPTNVRTIFSSSWTREANELVYTVRGSGFLHHMVRNLVGTFILVGKETIKPESLAEILAARNRSAAGPTAPAAGLYLVNVEY